MRRWILKALCMVGLVALAGCSDDSSEDPCAGANPAPSCTANNVNNTNNVNNSNNSNNSNNVNNVNNVACDPMCSGETPVCDEGTCVECAGNDDCTDGICNANGACVACVESTDCPAEAPICFGAGESAACIECAGNNDCTDGVCDTTNNVCVGCFGDGDCANDEVCDTTNNVCVGCVDNNDCTDGVCDTSQSVCVACLESSDCTEADASVCDTSGAAPVCVGCQSEADCSGIAGANHCIAEVCVDCKIESEAADCNGNFCGTDNQCTSTPVGAVTGCGECASDADCASGNRCIPMNYDGSFHGNYCMPVPIDNNGSPDCPRPFGGGIASMRSTTDGAMVDVCVVKEANTTCEAIAVYEDSCTPTNGNEPSAGDCEVGGMTAPGAICEPVGGINRCTYTCSGDPDCESGVSCGGPIGAKYCGG